LTGIGCTDRTPPPSEPSGSLRVWQFNETETSMNAIIYLVGLVVVVMAILSFFGLR